MKYKAPLYYSPSLDAWFYGSIWGQKNLATYGVKPPPDDIFHVTGHIIPLYDEKPRDTHWYGGSSSVEVWCVNDFGTPSVKTLWSDVPTIFWKKIAANALTYSLEKL